MVRARVVEAHELALKRQGKANPELTTREIERHCSPDDKGAMLLRQAIGRLMLSARGYCRLDALHMVRSSRASGFATFDQRLAKRANDLALSPPVELLF